MPPLLCGNSGGMIPGPLCGPIVGIVRGGEMAPFMFGPFSALFYLIYDYFIMNRYFSPLWGYLGPCCPVFAFSPLLYVHEWAELLPVSLLIFWAAAGPSLRKKYLFFNFLLSRVNPYVIL